MLERVRPQAKGAETIAKTIAIIAITIAITAIVEDNISEITERIRIIKAKFYPGTTKSWAEKVLGVKQQSLDLVLKGSVKPNLFLVGQILRVYPNISSEWLICGKNGMFGDYSISADSEKALIASQKTDIELLSRQVERQEQEIADLKEALKKKNELLERFFTQSNE